MSKIISLTASNFCKLKAVYIRPDGALVQVRGRNAQGKSSVINAIWAALGGASAFPPVPVRIGEEVATVKLELDDLIVTRTIKADGTTKLEVAGLDGRKHTSPQTMLNQLVAGLSFDPLAFTRMEKKERNETLRKLVGIDFATLDLERQQKYDARTDVGKDARRFEAELEGAPFDITAPVGEVSVSKLVVDLQAMNTARDGVAARRRDVERLKDESAQHLREVAVINEQIKVLEARMDALRADASGKLIVAEKFLGEICAARGPSDADVAALQAKIASSDAVNAKVRGNMRHLQLKKQADEKRAHYEALSSRIAEIDETKARQLREAKCPLHGLQLTEDGVMLDGLPFEQASGAQQLRASVAMGMALSGGLKVMLVREGSALDAESLQLMSDMAEEWGGGVWVERVSDERVGPGVLIEDGAVAAVESEAAE